MKIKWGALVVDGRNKIGGHVASRNKAGAYLRTKVTPLNPATAAQAAVRSEFTGRAQAWRGLTDAQRGGWRGGVANFVSTDIFGDTLTPSGFQLHMLLNGNLAAISETELQEIPSPGSVFAFATFTITYTLITKILSALFTDAIPVTDKVILSATPGMSAGKKFVKSEYRQIAVLSSTDTTPYDFTADYAAKYGANPAVGLKVFARVKPVLIASGQSGIERSDEAEILPEA